MTIISGIIIFLVIFLVFLAGVAVGAAAISAAYRRELKQLDAFLIASIGALDEDEGALDDLLLRFEQDSALPDFPGPSLRGEDV